MSITTQSLDLEIVQTIFKISTGFKYCPHSEGKDNTLPTFFFFMVNTSAPSALCSDDLHLTFRD